MPKIHYTRFLGDREVANLLDFLAIRPTRPTSSQQVVVMEFGKRHDTTDTADFCPHELVTDLPFMLRTCCGLVTEKSPTCHELVYGETGVMYL